MQQRYEAQTHRSVFVPIIAFFITAVLVLFVISRLQIADSREKQNHARNLVQSVSYNLQAIFNEYFDVTQFLKNLVIRNDGKVYDFSLIAESIYAGNPSIENIQLAPDGIISYSYPPQRENEHINLFTDPIHRDDAKYSRLTKMTTITGPFAQRKGGSGLAIRTPIYLTDKKGNDVFWGFSIITLRAAELFREAHVSDLKADNYRYQLKAINPHKGKLEMVDCSTYDTLVNPVSHAFDMHNTAWTFYVTPKDGWMDSSTLVFEILVGFIFTIMVAFSANSLWKLIKRESTFKRLSYIDTLTGLYNSRKFYELLHELHEKNEQFAVLYVDLNKFKPVNDLYGHKSGDELLTIVAKKLKNVIRAGDEVFRIGGDEFAIIVPNGITINGLSGLTQRLKASVGRPTVLGNATVNVTAAIGYARYPQDGAVFENIIQIAEEMMYADKKAMGEER